MVTNGVSKIRRPIQQIILRHLPSFPNILLYLPASIFNPVLVHMPKREDENVNERDCMKAINHASWLRIAWYIERQALTAFNYSHSREGRCGTQRVNHHLSFKAASTGVTWTMPPCSSEVKTMEAPHTNSYLVVVTSSQMKGGTSSVIRQCLQLETYNHISASSEENVWSEVGVGHPYSHLPHSSHC